MATWGQLLREIQIRVEKEGPTAVDNVRRESLQAVVKITGRPLIVYASQWTTPGPPAELISIGEQDLQGLMEVVHGLAEGPLDILLHSPGGSAESTEAMVSYLRAKFTDIRVIVPHGAMSAATMWACAANRIVLAKHSSLGPIDPQMVIRDNMGNLQMHPAQAILDQFRQAQEECKDSRLLASWVPILSQYGPALLQVCENQLALAKMLVGDWLATYMFEGEPDAVDRGGAIAAELAAHKTFLSHGRRINRVRARDLGSIGRGLLVEDLEANQDFQDAVMTLYHAITLTFGMTPCVKLIENNLGSLFAVQFQPPGANLPVIMQQPDNGAKMAIEKKKPGYPNPRTPRR